MNDWLTNLQKAHETPAPAAAPLSKLAATEAKLPGLLRTLLQSGDDMLDDSDADVPDPFAKFLQSIEKKRFGISEISAAILGKSAGMQDGERVEPGVGGTWTHHYRRGLHVASRFEDSVKSSGVMHFDHAGKEISADAYADLLKNPTLQAASAISNLPEHLSKIFGLTDLAQD